jgi:Tol biopolymer transport system component
MLKKILKTLLHLVEITYKCLFIAYILGFGSIIASLVAFLTKHYWGALPLGIIAVIILLLVCLVLSTKAKLGEAITKKAFGLAIGGFLLAAAVLVTYYVVGSASTPNNFTSLPLTGLAGYEQDPSFSPDGSEVAYVWSGQKNETRSIHIKRVGSGVPFPLTSDVHGDVESPVWFENGKHIAYVRPVGDKAELWEIPSLKGPEHKLGETFLYPPNLNRHPGIAVSPDGLYLAVPNGGSPSEPPGIFVLTRKTGSWRRLTSAVFADCLPSFSPDGQQIAFVGSTALGVEDVYVVPLGGGEPKRLTSDRARFNGVTWTPDGKEIVFASNRGGNFALWRMKASGGAPATLGITAEFLANPSISRRGRRLAYVQESWNVNIRSLEMQPGRNAPVRSVKFISSSGEESSPQYSPNGDKIAFVSNRSGFIEIYVSDADGSNPIAVTDFHGLFITGTPRWSPDGQQIVFDSRPSGSSRIYVTRTDGMGEPRLVTSGPGDDAVPSWSVDRNWIFYTSTSAGRSEIWKVPVAGGERIQLTHRGGFAPLPSPDGRFVFYAKGVSKTGIWRVPEEGGEETQVMDDLQPGFWGQWAVTNAGIYFMRLDAQQARIQFFRFATQKVEHIFSPENSPEPATDGLAVSPDGRRILYTQVDQRKTNIMLVEDFH